jgi:hypothetical protein
VSFATQPEGAAGRETDRNGLERVPLREQGWNYWQWSFGGQQHNVHYITEGQQGSPVVLVHGECRAPLLPVCCSIIGRLLQARHIAFFVGQLPTPGIGVEPRERDDCGVADAANPRMVQRCVRARRRLTRADPRLPRVTRSWRLRAGRMPSAWTRAAYRKANLSAGPVTALSASAAELLLGPPRLASNSLRRLDTVLRVRSARIPLAVHHPGAGEEAPRVQHLPVGLWVVRQGGCGVLGRDVGQAGECVIPVTWQCRRGVRVARGAERATRRHTRMSHQLPLRN